MSWTCTSCGEENKLSRPACNCCGFAKPEASAATQGYAHNCASGQSTDSISLSASAGASPKGVNFLVIGNPGVGKSTMLNGLIMKPHFKSGVSWGQGMTYQLDIYRDQLHTYMDTPGLADTVLRKKAAAAITEALKQGGHYKIFFVMTLEAGRVRAADVTTMALVLEAAPITSYGIIINKLQPATLHALKANNANPSPQDLVLQCVWSELKPQQKTLHIHFVAHESELAERDNVVQPLPTDLLAFMERMPGMIIEPPSVKAVKENLFEEKFAAQQAALEQVMRDKKKMEDALNLNNAEVAELRKLRADEQKATADRAAELQAIQQQIKIIQADRAEKERQLAAQQKIADGLSEQLSQMKMQKPDNTKTEQILEKLAGKLDELTTPKSTHQPVESANPTSDLKAKVEQLEKEANDAKQDVKNLKSSLSSAEAMYKKLEERGFGQIVWGGIVNTWKGFFK